MKSIVALVAIVAGLASASGQGTVNFSNTGAFPTPVDRFVYIDLPGGTKLTGTNYAAALYFGYSADTVNQLAVRSENDLTLLSAIGLFRAVDPLSPAAGTWAGGTRYLLGATIGQQIKLQVRVWDIAKFATFDDARAGGGSIAQSCPFDYTVPAPTDALGNKMENFVGLPDYRCVPEPSTLVMSALGLGALLLCRVRRRDERPRDR